MSSTQGRMFSPGFKRLLWLTASLHSLVWLKGLAKSFAPPVLYQKDFISPYLMAKAILNGVNPYLPLPELASRWIVDANNYSSLNHPTPHTPLHGLLCVPLGLLSYQTAALVWLVIELLCLLATIILLLRYWKKPLTPQSVLLPFSLVLGWLPALEGLWLGQLNTCLLLLLVGSWLCLRTEKQVCGGALLGGAIALKLLAWPLVILLAVRHKWRGVAAAAAVLTSANVLAIGVLGINCVKDYYLKIAPLVAALHRPQDCNISTWTIGERLFGGIGYYSAAPPLWPAPALATFCTYSLPLVVALVGLGLAIKMQNFDAAFWGLVIISILVSPIAWTHYLLLATIPMGIIARQLWGRKDWRKLLALALCLGLPLSLIGGMYQALSQQFATQISPAGWGIIFSARMLPFLPALALLGLFWSLWRLAAPAHEPANE